MTKSIAALENKGIYKYYVLDDLRKLSSRAYQEEAWRRSDMSSNINEDGAALIDGSLSHCIEEGLLVVSEDIDPMFEEIFQLSERFDATEESVEDILNDPITEQIRQKAAHIIPFLERKTSNQSDVIFFAYVRIPLFDGTISEHYEARCEELPNGTFLFLNPRDDVKPEVYTQFRYKVADILRCSKSLTDDFRRETIITAVEKVGYEEVIPYL